MSLIAAAAIAGCDSPPAVAPSPPAASSVEPAAGEVKVPAPIAELPLTMTLEQRSTTPVPGSDGKLSLTIDDITREQVTVSVLDADNTALAGPISLTTGQTAPFRVGETGYHLRLEKLSNALVGSDFATFVIDAPAAGESPAADVALTEPQKIERLIAAVESLPNATFIRNGDAHTAAEAAEHLRTKMSAAGDEIQTAEDFIEQIASRSSLSGEEYQIRMGDGRTRSSREFLQQELKKLEAPATGSRLEN